MIKDYITVFTPSYNRAYKLKDLYNSLVSQNNQYFEWLIIDDGSSDDTKEMVTSFINEEKLNIRYIYKKNEGKHIAINEAAKLANGEWFFIVDSDDYITASSLEIIMNYCNMIDDNPDFAGVVGLRGNEEGNAWTTGSLKKIKARDTSENKNFTSKEFIDCTSIEYRYKHKIQGDRAEVIKTEILKKYPFPKFNEENFMPENYLWFSLSRDGYKFRWFNRIIYVTEYLEDGLTKNGRLLAKKNCNSRSYLDNFIITLDGIPIKEKIKSTINYYRYGKLSGKSWINLIKECNNRLLSIIALPIAMITRL